MKYILLAFISSSLLLSTSCKKCYRCVKQSFTTVDGFVAPGVPEVEEVCDTKKKLDTKKNDGFKCLEIQKNEK